MMSEEQVIEEETYFLKDSVYLHTTILSENDEKTYDTVKGQLSVRRNRRGTVCVEWEPKEQTVTSDASDWTVVDTVEYKNANGSANESVKIESRSILQISFPVNSLKKFKVATSRRHQQGVGDDGRCCDVDSGEESITFTTHDATTHPSLYMHEGGSDTFIRTLNAYVSIVRSAAEKGVYLVTEYNGDESGLDKPMSVLGFVSAAAAATSHHALSKYVHRPVTAALGGFSKVANYVVDTVIAPPSTSRPVAELAEDLLPSRYNLTNIKVFEQDYELISDTHLPDLQVCERGEAVSLSEWKEHEAEDGRIVRVNDLLQRIFKGGISSEVRPIAWRYLLGMYQYQDTRDEKLRKEQVYKDDYFRLKAQWKSMSPDQEQRFTLFRASKELAEKDVKRTDRTLDFYSGDGNKNVEMMFDILLTYVMYNFNLGYVQGMSDMLSPILMIIPHEVDAFWCFVNLMDKMGNHFEESQKTMLENLKHLHYLLRFYDHDLCNHLESVNASNMFICFRWLLVHFKREFQMEDHLTLWEALWTGLPCKNFDLLIALAMLEEGKDVIMEKKWSSEKILKYCNNIQGSISGDHILSVSEGIYNQLMEYAHSQQAFIPHTIRDLFNLPQSSHYNT